MRSWRIGLVIAVLAGAGCSSSSGRPLLGAAGAGGTGAGGSGGSGGRFTQNVSAVTPRAVDILFMVDNSSSMRLAQNNLLANFSSFVTALQGLPGGMPDVHIGVVSQDMGAGDGSIAGCQNDGNGLMPGGNQGIFQYTARGTCTTTGLNAGATYISNVGGVANYTGDLASVFKCIAALGETGCGFEHQFAAVLRALGADGQAAPQENQGFLRTDAKLMIVMLTNEDDCSAMPGIALYDTTSNVNVASMFGPPANYRCNEFGHLCSIGSGAPAHPRRLAPNNDVNATVAYDQCASNDTEGYLLSVKQTADALKALKVDASYVSVVAVSGAPTPYVVHWKNPSTMDTSCNTTGQSCPWPEITHSCTAADGSFADPGVRISQLVGEFGATGLQQSICDANFGPGLAQAAGLLASQVAPRCIDRLIADDPSKPGLQPDCTAVGHHNNGNNMFVDTPLPACADNGGAAPCWTLSKDFPSCSGSSVVITLDPASTTNPETVTLSCLPCAQDGSAGATDCY
ncbi:MAG TPA: hypothetical protein VKQ32_09445 [Polyangia bacterium]|nr:hypothetical protein [Polyangia bacterium]